MLQFVQFKEGVQLAVTQAVYEILQAAVTVYGNHGVVCTVTAGCDGKHNEHSKHYTGNALDLRIRDFELDELQPVVKSLQEILGQNFFVLLEKDHIHIQKGLKEHV